MITLDSLNLAQITPEKLGELLIEAKKAYYTTGRPTMSDHTYDTLEEILRKKAPYHRIFTKAGHPNFDTGWPKKKHLMPMGSQNKISTYSDLVHYFELKTSATGNVDMHRISYVVQPKCDGISLEIIYHLGQLTEAITRGDGETGDIITQNVVKMQQLPHNLSTTFSGSVRGEIVVTRTDFEQLNHRSDQKYSNPRNAASGLSQRLDSQFVELCTLFAVDIFPWHDTEINKIDFLTNLGFVPVESHLCATFENIENVFQRFLTSTRLNYPYEIDGLVIKINDPQIAANLGTKNNRPKYQVAYKFPASDNQTTIKSIEWQVGPMGTITPVAQVEPIELAGAIITYASLANHDLIIKKNLNIGDIVSISRRGDVIPHIDRVVSKVTSAHLAIPTACPACHTPLIKEDKFLKCPNTAWCLPQIIGSLNLFCNTLGILGLSSKTISKLYTAGRVLIPGDFYKLTVADIKDLDNLGEISGRNIVHQIQSRRELTLAEAFDAAIIPHFSVKRLQQVIAAGFDTPQKILHLSLANLLSLPGFKETLAKKIIAGINLRRSWIESILSQVTITTTPQDSQLSKISFCITGNLNIARADLVKLIESHGGQVMSTVTPKTNYLICNLATSSSSKFTTAQRLGVKIITENDFQKLLWSGRTTPS